MIIKQTPVLRRDWPAGTTGTDKSEGKFAKLSRRRQDHVPGDLRHRHPRWCCQQP